MQVRMKGECLSPGMEYAYHTCLSSQPLMVMTKAVKHTPYCLKQQRIQYLRLIQTQLVKGIRKGKDYMKIRDRQEFFFSCLYPFFPVISLAFRAMPVPAAIIADRKQSTVCTTINMTTRLLGSATPDCIKSAYLPCIKTAAMLHY